MKSTFLHPAMLAAMGAGTLATGLMPSATAQTPQLEELAPETGWFIRLGGFVRTGAKLSLKDRSIATPALADDSNASSNAGMIVKLDASGSTTDTYNWGYTGATSEKYTTAPQYTAGGNTLTFQHLANAPRVGDVDLGSQSLYGGQVTGGFEVSRFKLGRKEVKWGFEVGYSYSTLSASAAASAGSSSAVLTTHEYSLLEGGLVLVPPAAPFTGSPTGPNFLLPRGLSATTSLPTAGTATLNATLDADIHTLRLGPWFEFPLAPRLWLGFSVGYATTLADSELRLQESTAYVGNAIPGQDLGTASFRRSEWVPGAYAQLRATYMFTQHIGAFVGGELQWSSDLNFAARNREAELRLGATFGGVVGVNLSF